MERDYMTREELIKELCELRDKAEVIRKQLGPEWDQNKQSSGSIDHKLHVIRGTADKGVKYLECRNCMRDDKILGRCKDCDRYYKKGYKNIL